MPMKVEVVPHDPNWQTAFEAESQLVAAALGTNLVVIHHIGSTAIPGIHAKPIIDLLVEVRNIQQVDASQFAMEALGYEGLGEFGIPGRRYFRKENSQKVRTHHVHIFEENSPHVVRHLAFRDFMKSHPKEAQQYSDLKRGLAQAHPDNIEAYMDGKEAFIKEMERRAVDWKGSQWATK